MRENKKYVIKRLFITAATAIILATGFIFIISVTSITGKTYCVELQVLPGGINGVENVEAAAIEQEMILRNLNQTLGGNFKWENPNGQGGVIEYRNGVPVSPSAPQTSVSSTPSTTPMQPTTPAQPTTPKKVKGSYVLLATGTVVKPGGSIPLSQLATAVFVNGTGQNVMYTAVASQGAYRVKADPEPNWAYEASVAPGGAIPLAHYATYMLDPYYTHLTVELRGTKDYEYSFAVNKAQ